MGARGPLPDPRSRRGARRGSNAALSLVPGHPDAVPELPEGVGRAGAEAWEEAWGCEWALTSDARSIEHLARLEDERAALLAEIDHSGLLLTKPVVSPRGDVVGSESYANPLLAQLRRLDGPIMTLRAALGLSPMARARLGQAVVQIRKDENVLKRQEIMNRYRKAAGDE